MKLKYISPILKLITLLIFFTTCENAESISKPTAKEGASFKEDSYEITPLEFASSEDIKLLRHAGIYYPAKFQLDYNSTKKRFHFWAEIWRGNRLTVKRILTVGNYEESQSKEENNILGKGYFDIEISENRQMLNDLNKVTINTFIGKGNNSNQTFSFDIDSFPRGGVHHLLQNFYTNPQDFYFTFACYGQGACSSYDLEFPHKVKTRSRTGEECTVIFRGLFCDSYKEFMMFFQNKYQNYRPFESNYNLKWEI